MADELLIAKNLFVRFVEACVVLLVAIAFLAFTGQSVTPRVIDSAVAVEYRTTAPLDLQSAWVEAETLGLVDLPHPQTDAWLRWSPVRDLPRDRPLAIQMGGPFSADVYFNGVLIGSKGVPGSTPDDERAGQIDGLFAIPSGLIGDEGNRVTLHYSSHHAGYQPAILLQTLSILPYRDDSRRPLRYYAPIILVAGALAGLILLASSSQVFLPLAQVCCAMAFCGGRLRPNGCALYSGEPSRWPPYGSWRLADTMPAHP